MQAMKLSDQKGQSLDPPPAHPHLRVGSKESSISLDGDCTLLELSLIVGKGELIFLLC